MTPKQLTMIQQSAALAQTYGTAAQQMAALGNQIDGSDDELIGLALSASESLAVAVQAAFTFHARLTAIALNQIHGDKGPAPQPSRTEQPAE